ncbi:hypothetical protein BaRGS_00033434 [Batillaria attramentaria]|uniref:C-type lectin domain-containing protein n=1 Tax=Batillaria attramentaria TaxID=370345 RepID=A0ABD0JK41_9CAEN
MLYREFACILVFPIWSVVDAQCMDGWVRYENSCYGIGDETVTWGGAQEMCQLFDSSLAEVESSDENGFLKEIARNHSYAAVWLGGTDVFSEGRWIWVGSRKLIESGFSDWYPGEPNAQNGEDCLQLYRNEHYQWNDNACESTAVFFCETQ